MNALDIFTKKEIYKSLNFYYKDFSDLLINRMIETSILIELNSQSFLIKQGESGKDVFLLLAGKLQVIYQDQYGVERIVNNINEGEFLGEMSLFLDENRTTSVKASRHSFLLKFSPQIFQELLDTEIDLLKYISNTLIKRLSSSNEGANRKNKTNIISVLPLENTMKSDQFASQLAQSISTKESVKVVSVKTVIDQEIWKKGATESENRSRLFKYIIEKIKEYSYIIFQGDLENELWLNTIVDQSDKILIFCSGKTYTALPKVLADKIEPIDKTIVTLDIDTQHLGTYRALNTKDRVPTMHLAGMKDVDRLARHITGTSIKLVLGGGGAKGLAHLGVFRAMNELSIPIDFIGGTSIGSIMAAIIAVGLPYEEIVEIAKKRFVDDKPLNDYRLPMTSLIAGDKMDRSLIEAFGDTHIEDLAIPFFCVAANLSTARTEIISDGLVSQAIRASISLPGILPPAVRNGQLMLDGGIVDNLPLEHMNTLSDGPSFGVDLSNITRRELGYDKVPSNSQLMLNKITRKKKYKVPNIYQTIMGTMTLASNEKRLAYENKFDVLIKPAVSRYGFLNFDRIDDLIEEGYSASFSVLQDWKAKNTL